MFNVSCFYPFLRPKRADAGLTTLRKPSTNPFSALPVLAVLLHLPIVQVQQVAKLAVEAEQALYEATRRRAAPSLAEALAM